MSQLGQPSPPDLYPLVLEPTAVERIWGGARLGALLGKAAPAGARIGETWETALEAQVSNGPLVGRALGDVARRYGPALLGARPRVTSEIPFPLLVKFLDAADVLSIQVHPDDAYAQTRLAEPFGKTEAWHIVAAEPGAVIYHGLAADLAPDEVAAALAAGRLAAHLHAEVVHAGDTLFTPAGTIHAIGGGILLYEIQQYSDVTFRLHDWDRLGADGRPREIHVAQGLAVADPTSHAHHTIPPQPLDDRGERTILVACRYFALEAREFGGAQTLTLDGATCHLLTVLTGELEIADGRGGAATVALGQTALLPADSGAVRLEAAPGARVLDAYVPDLARDVIAPLRARGVPDKAIARLGGGAAKGNDLLPLLAGRD